MPTKSQIDENEAEVFRFVGVSTIFILFVCRQLMMGLFQLLLSVSQSKSQVLLYRLDVNLLGTSSEAKVFYIYVFLYLFDFFTHIVIIPKKKLQST